jgi:multisubunit Na+/H+ antiporter MnhC subunit
MTTTRTARATAIAAFAIVGWAVCAATIGIGFNLITERGALILHAIVAPIAFAGLSWLYFTRFAYTGPLPTALFFLAIVVGLDVFVVALLIERSFAMFASALGTWAPLFLIFASTWATGILVCRAKRVRRQ